MADEDIDKLFEVLVEFAQRLLAKYGEFYPFGASIATDGQVQIANTFDGSEQPSPDEVIALLTASFQKQAQAGAIRAAAICVDVRTVPPSQTEKTDAIHVSVEQENGSAVDAFLPYRKGWFKRISYGEPFAGGRDRTIFTS